MTTADTYWDACIRAATRQGLMPAEEALERIFGEDCGLYQSGGFVMVIQVECPQVGGYCWVTYEGRVDDDGTPLDDDEYSYLVGYYPAGDDVYESESSTECNFANLPEVIAHYRLKGGVTP